MNNDFGLSTEAYLAYKAQIDEIDQLYKQVQFMVGIEIYDYRDVTPDYFELYPKDAQVNLRIQSGLLRHYKKRARHFGVPYQRLMREALGKGLRPEWTTPRNMDID